MKTIDTENQFTLIFIFDNTKENVLMQHKIRGPYPNCLNGVGGHIREDEINYPMTSALRELLEETDISINDLEHFNWLVTCQYPSGTILYVYYGVLYEGVDFEQIEDEELEWFTTGYFTNINDDTIAGEGNTQYFINAALIELKNRSKV